MVPADELLDIVIVNGEPYSVMIATELRQRIEAEAVRLGVEPERMMRLVVEDARRQQQARTNP